MKESLERQLALTENIQATLEKKLAESVKKETEQRISLESANATIAGVYYNYCNSMLTCIVEKSIKYADCCGGSRTETTD